MKMYEEQTRAMDYSLLSTQLFQTTKINKKTLVKKTKTQKREPKPIRKKRQLKCWKIKIKTMSQKLYLSHDSVFFGWVRIFLYDFSTKLAFSINLNFSDFLIQNFCALECECESVLVCVFVYVCEGVLRILWFSNGKCFLCTENSLTTSINNKQGNRNKIHQINDFNDSKNATTSNCKRNGKNKTFKMNPHRSWWNRRKINREKKKQRD